MATTPTTVFKKVSTRVPPIDYTSRDFQSISTDLVRTIPFFSPEWTDHNLSDFGIVLQRLVAYCADVLHFYIDRHANEAFLPTAITRRSVINLLKLIDFKLRSAVPATVDVAFTLSDPLAGDFLIPAGTEIQTSVDRNDVSDFPVIFETIRDLVIPMGALEGTTAAIEGQTKDEDFGVSTGVARQKYDLVGNPIIDGSLRIFIDEGAGEQLWTEVDSFIFSREDDKHFVTQRDEEDKITVFFGDNAQGKIPDPGSVLHANYRIGGGLRGNVGAETITVVNRTFTFDALPVLVAVVNPLSASGGEDRMSIDEAKTLGPRSLRSLNRAVTADDYVTLSEAFPGVAKAEVQVGGGQAGCCCIVAICIAPRGGGVPSSELKRDLLEFLEARKMIGTCLEIRDPSYVPVDIEGNVFVAQNFAVDKVALDMSKAVDQFFDSTGDFVGFDQDLNLSDILHSLDAVPGVDHIDLTQLTRRPVPRKEIWEGDCEFSLIAVGTEAKEEEWTVVFVDATTLSVKGSVSGIQTKRATVGVPYTSDKKEVGFTLSCGSGKPPCVGDRATFITSKKMANVPINGCEIMEKGTVVLNFVGGARAQRECV